MQTLECISQKWHFFQCCHYNIAEMVFFNHNIMLQAQCVWKRYFIIMTWECNLWSDIRWNQQGVFSCWEENSALQFWPSNEMSLTLTDTHSDSKRQGIIHLGGSHIFWTLKKQVHSHDPREQRLMSTTNLLSFPIHIKTLWFTVVDVSRVKVMWHAAMVLLQKNYRGATCGQSGEAWPQCWHSLVL